MTHQSNKSIKTNKLFSLISIKNAGTRITTLIGILWPFAVYFSWHYDCAQILCLIFIVLFLLRIITYRCPVQKLKPLFSCALFTSVIAITISIIALLSKSADLLRYYPVAVNFIFLTCFGISLVKTPSIITRFAAITEKKITPEIKTYTWKVTVVWSCFFLVNGLISLYTVIYGNNETWLAWNGVGSYIAIATLMGIEYLIRCRLRNKGKLR